MLQQGRPRQMKPRTTHNIILPSFTLHFVSQTQIPFPYRNVDNRFVFSPKYIRDHSSLIQFLDLCFYRPPVCVGDLTVLGLTVCLKSKTFKYTVPSHFWQFRSVRARTTATSHMVHFCHVEAFVKYCLESSVFVSMGKFFSQSRGACMGSPLAPVLCSLVATIE